MPHVYKELHSSFVSLVWFQSGRSLPLGNQWMWPSGGIGAPQGCRELFWGVGVLGVNWGLVVTPGTQRPEGV